MNAKLPVRRYRLAAMLTIGILIGGLTGQSLSAPAPAPAPQQPATSPFGRLVPMAPTGQTVAPGAGGAIPSQSQAPLAAPAPAAPAAAAAGAPAAGGVPSAVQTPRIIVIDRQQLLQRSAAGKDIFTQTQTLSKQLETQLRTEETALQGEAVQLQQQLAILAADVRAQREKDFTAKQQAFQGRVQQRQAQIQASFNAAARQVEVALDPILQAIMRERGANMVLDRSAVIVATSDVDVTPLALQRLDRALPRVKVDLAATPAVAAPPAAAAAPAPAATAKAAAPAPAAK
jgi:Skp family chaperone for outer membrane proteins